MAVVEEAGAGEDTEEDQTYQVCVCVVIDDDSLCQDILI